jgi:acetyltransferase-like isoleucine patch superfamily enzyme
MVKTLLKIINKLGLLNRLMRTLVFRKILGRYNLVTSWRLLGCKIDDNVYLSARVNINLPQNVEIGSGTKISGKTVIDAWGKIRIGKNVLMNNEIKLFAGGHALDSPTFFEEVDSFSKAFINIGDYVWLPHNIIVLPGVTIGDFAVIGTGSVVTKNVPSYGVAAGNPARVIKERAKIEYTYVPSSW